MPRITASAPVLLVRDVVAAADYFRDAVGFTSVQLWGHPPDFCICQRDGHYLMLARAPDPAQIKPLWQLRENTWNAYFWVDDADAMYAELRARGARIDSELHDKPYGVREFGIQDLDDHDLAFGQVLR